MCSPCSPSRYNMPEPTWRQPVYGFAPYAELPAPVYEAPPAQPPRSRIIPRKVPGKEDNMGILDFFLPSRRRRREEERRRAEFEAFKDTQERVMKERQKRNRWQRENTYTARAVDVAAQRRHAAAEQDRRVSSDTSGMDLANPLNPLNPMYPLLFGGGPYASPDGPATPSHSSGHDGAGGHAHHSTPSHGGSDSSYDSSSGGGSSGGDSGGSSSGGGSSE